MVERAERRPDNGKRRIPWIIHQVFIGGKLTPELQANVDALKARNPGWEHHLYDDERAEKLIRDVYGNEMLAIYHKISPEYLAARVDLLCNLIIYDAGGVYLDIKSTFERPLDEIVRDDDSYILAQWHNGPGERNKGWGLHRDLAHILGGEYMKHFIIAEPHHPYSVSIIRKIVDNVKTYKPWSAVGRTGTLRTTGPIAYTLGIHPIRDQHPHRFATEEELGAVYSIGEGYDHYTVFKKHYTTQISPVVTLSKAGTLFSRLFVGLRIVKHAIIKPTADPWLEIGAR
jgi:mannosyltransferase OCH1-like enzyme